MKRMKYCIAAASLLAGATAHADPVVGVATLPKISVGEYHMLLAKTDGTVWSWGWDAHGELGRGAGTTATPTQIPTLSGVVSVVARSSFSMALKADGTVWVWGDNSNGRMGPTNTASTVPVQVAGLSSIIGIEAGWGFSAYAIDLTRKVYGWGRNTNGELGTGSATPASVTTPQLISGLSSIVDLRAADTSVIALDSSGQVFQWATIGQPTPITTLAGVSGAVAIGADAVNNTNPSFAVLGTGEVMSWGDTNSGVTRCGQSSQAGASPAKLTGFANITSVSSGPDGEDVFLDSAGQAWTCGGGSGGQQGDGTATGTGNAPVKIGPVKVTQTTPFVNVAMGRSAAGIGTDGSVWTWGQTGSVGVQGDGNLSASAPILAPTKISTITAGDPAKVQPVYAGTQSATGTDGISTVDAGVMFAPEHWSKTGQVYLVAVLPGGQIYAYSATTGWGAYDPRLPIAAAYTGSLKGMRPFNIGKLDFRSLAGTQLIVGYGQGSGAAADNEMFGAGRYKSVLTLR